MMGAVTFLLSNADVLGQTAGNGTNCSTITATGDCSYAIGSGAVAVGAHSISIGIGSTAGTSSNISGFAFGSAAYAQAENSVAIGIGVGTDSNSEYNLVIGSKGASNFTNSIDHSIMLGTKLSGTNPPTLYLEDPDLSSQAFGNVGVGTVNPESRLHVYDEIRVGSTSGANGSLVFNNSAGNTITLNTPTSMSTQSYTLPTAVGTVNQVLALTGVSGSVGTLGWVSGGGSTTAWELAGNIDASSSSILGATVPGVPLRIYAGNAERIRVASDGNVGIGTSSPADLLHLYTAGNTSLRVQYGTSSSGYLRFWSPSALTGFLGMDNSNVFRIFNQVAEGDVRVGIVKIGDSSSSDAMRVIGSSGNVGIGTNSSGARLSVVQSKSNGAGSTPMAQERVARFAVSDASSDWLELLNRTAVDNEFAPMMQTVSTQSAEPALTIDAQTDSTNDTGSVPMMEFSVRRDNNTDVGTRPLFEWNNRTSSKMLMKADGNLGIGTTAPSGRLHVNGTVFITSFALPGGDASDHTIGVDIDNNQLIDISASSAYFKDNITDIEFDKEAFLNLRPVDYTWREACGGGSDVGLIAQEVNEVFPVLATKGLKRTYLDNGDMVRDSLGIPVVDSTQMEVRGVRYHKLPVYLLAIAKDQQQELAELRNQVQELTDRLDGCCASVTPMNRLNNEPTQQAQIKEQMDEFILLQNDPNPFGDYTDIRYEHDECTSCEIIISDMSGRIIKRIKTSGSKGTVRVYSSEIGSGLFIYSLVKDGQTVRSERMVSSNR